MGSAITIALMAVVGSILMAVLTRARTRRNSKLMIEAMHEAETTSKALAGYVEQIKKLELENLHLTQENKGLSSLVEEQKKYEQQLSSSYSEQISLLQTRVYELSANDRLKEIRDEIQRMYGSFDELREKVSSLSEEAVKSRQSERS